MQLKIVDATQVIEKDFCKPDVHAVIVFDGGSYKTKVCNATAEPVWNEDFTVANASAPLHCRLYDGKELLCEGTVPAGALQAGSCAVQLTCPDGCFGGELHLRAADLAAATGGGNGRRAAPSAVAGQTGQKVKVPALPPPRENLRSLSSNIDTGTPHWGPKRSAPPPNYADFVSGVAQPPQSGRSEMSSNVAADYALLERQSLEVGGGRHERPGEHGLGNGLSQHVTFDSQYHAPPPPAPAQPEQHWNHAPPPPAPAQQPANAGSTLGYDPTAHHSEGVLYGRGIPPPNSSASVGPDMYPMSARMGGAAYIDLPATTHASASVSHALPPAPQLRRGPVAGPSRPPIVPPTLIPSTPLDSAAPPAEPFFNPYANYDYAYDAYTTPAEPPIDAPPVDVQAKRSAPIAGLQPHARNISPRAKATKRVYESNATAKRRNASEKVRNHSADNSGSRKYRSHDTSVPTQHLCGLEHLSVDASYLSTERWHRSKTGAGIIVSAFDVPLLKSGLR